MGGIVSLILPRPSDMVIPYHHIVNRQGGICCSSAAATIRLMVSNQPRGHDAAGTKADFSLRLTMVCLRLRYEPP